MQYRKKTRRTKKLTNGQLNLLGDVYGFGLVYQPQISHNKGGLYIVVTRIPEDKTKDRLYRAVADKAAKQLSQTITQPIKYTRHNYDYYED